MRADGRDSESLLILWQPRQVTRRPQMYCCEQRTKGVVTKTERRASPTREDGGTREGEWGKRVPSSTPTPPLSSPLPHPPFGPHLAPTRMLLVLWSSSHALYNGTLASLSTTTPLSLVRLQTNNDPSAGSPTETLLRLLLPLDAGARGVSVHAGRVLQTTRRNIQSVGATGGVYKGQGRIQHAITNTCLRGIPSSRPIVARDDPNQDGASQGCRFISELASTYCSRHCSTRAAQ